MSKFESLLSQRRIFKTNLLFIFVFLNIWEFIISRDLINGMIFGVIMFGPVAFLWHLRNLRASMIATLISIFEVTALSVFVIEGFEFGGAAAALKSFYWVPYLGMATVNMIVGLRIYAAYRQGHASLTSSELRQGHASLTSSELRQGHVVLAGAAGLKMKRSRK